MLAAQTLSSLALLAICALNVGVAQTDAGDTDPDEVIEEVVVKAVNECGTWPIRHRRLIGCDYVELEIRDLEIVLALRPKLLSRCLICKGTQCSPNMSPEHNPVERLICRRVFWTPTKVSRYMTTGGRGGPLRVSFSFTISSTGRVKDIEVSSFEGDISQQSLLDLIENGASTTKFEPLVVEDVTYEIVGLKDAYIL